MCWYEILRVRESQVRVCYFHASTFREDQPAYSAYSVNSNLWAVYSAELSDNYICGSE